MTGSASGAADAERGLALSYAPPFARAGLGALLTLDARLAGIVRSAREPIVGQMRLTWWYEALVGLDTGAIPAEPVLRALYEAVLPRGVTGAVLAGMIDAWERLLDPEPLGASAMASFASARGGVLFRAAATVCGTDPEQSGVGGEGWALADLCGHLSDPHEAAVARAMAVERVDRAFATRWPRDARALGALILLARFDLMTPSPPRAGYRRVLRLIRHRWNGT